MISFQSFFRQRMTRFFSILFSTLLLIANLAIYLVSSVQYTRQIERLESSFVEMMTHLILQENNETALIFIEHYDHTHGVQLAYYDPQGTILYQSEIPPKNDQRIVLRSPDQTIIGELALDYQSSFLDTEITVGIMILNGFSLFLFGIALFILYRYLNRQYAILNADLEQIGTTKHQFRYSDMESINQRYLASLATEAELKEVQAHYVQILAHDVKTPLTVMKAYVEGAKLGRIAWSPTLLDDILTEIGLIEAIVPQFIAANLDQLPKRQNIAPILKSQLDRLRGVFMTKQMRVVAELDDFEINVAAIDIIRLMEHLVFNAFYYSEPNKQITIRLNAKQRTLSVQDEGIGMSKETIEKILNGSYREESSTKYHKKGSGIGFQIVQSILKKLHAELTIESTIQVGTTVTIQF